MKGFGEVSPIEPQDNHALSERGKSLEDQCNFPYMTMYRRAASLSRCVTLGVEGAPLI